MNISEYLTLINVAFLGQNNEQRKQAEQELLIKCCQDREGISKLVSIVSDDKQSDFYRETSALLTTTIIKKLQVSPTPYPSELQLQHIELFVKVLQTQGVSFKLKNHISVSLGHLQAYTIRGFDKNVNSRQQLQNYCKQLLDSQSMDQVEGGCFVFQSLLGSLDSLNVCEDTQFGTDWILTYVQKGKDIVAALQQNEQKGQLLQLYRLWALNICDMCKRVLRARGLQKDQMVKLQNFLLQSEHLSLSLLQVLLYLPNQTQTIICQTGDQLLDNTINEAKGFALSSLNQILSHLLNERTKAEVRKSSLYMQLSQLLPTLIICMVAYTTNASFDLNSCLQNQSVSTIVAQVLRFISLCGGQSEFYNILSESKTSLIVDVVFPFLTTSKYEQDLMENEPEEFVNLALDTVDKQSSEIPKTAAAAMLEMFCDHIDGSTSLITNIAVLVINHSVHIIKEKNDGNINDPASRFFLLKDLQSRFFFSKINPIQRIDASLVILTVLSYLLSRRNDLIKYLEGMLAVNFAFFSDPKQDPIILARLCLFLGYYCDNLFKAEDQKTNLSEYISVLICQLQNYKNNQWGLAVVYQAVDALKNIFEDEELVPKIGTLIPQLFPLLCNSLLESTYDQHYDMIQSILKSYTAHFLKEPTLFQIVLDVLDKCLNGHTEAQLQINKSWNILRSLTDVPDYVTNFQPMIEQMLTPLFQMLESPAKVEFDEDIFLLVSAFIEKTKIISPLQKQLIFFCPKVQKKQNMRLGQIFDLLNNFIVYGKEEFQNIEIQKLVFGMAIAAMTSKGEVSNESDEGEGVLLIQLAIQCLNTTIHIDLLKNTLQTVLMRSQKEISQTFLKSRLMGVFLSAFLYDFERSKFILQEAGLLDSLFTQLVDNGWISDGGYDIKLYIFSMCSVLRTFPQVFSVKLIDTMVTLLKKQENFEAKQLVQKKREQNLIDSDDENEEFIDDEESDDIFNEEKQEATMSMITFKSTIKEKDEYEEFRLTIAYIKQYLPMNLDTLKRELTQEKLNFLITIVQYERVQLEEGLGAPRKIVKAVKRKNNQIN